MSTADLTLENLQRAKMLIDNSGRMQPEICFITTLFKDIIPFQFQVKNKYYLAINEELFEVIKKKSKAAEKERMFHAPTTGLNLLGVVYGMRVVYNDQQLKELFSECIGDFCRPEGIF
jgi:hypothetical protein